MMRFHHFIIIVCNMELSNTPSRNWTRIFKNINSKALSIQHVSGLFSYTCLDASLAQFIRVCSIFSRNSNIHHSSLDLFVYYYSGPYAVSVLVALIRS